MGGATSHNGGLRVQYAGTDVFRAGVMSGTLLNSYGAVGAAWFGSTYANAPTNGNWSIAANNNYTYLNGVNGVFVYANSAGSPSYLFGPTNLQMGAPYSVNHMAIDFVAATLWHFGAGATASATIQYDGQTTDVATLVLALKGQAAWASAATNIDGGWLTLQGGAAKGASSGSDGPIKCLSPFGMEGLTIQPSAGANAFTNAQSANGCFIFGPTQASAYTITIQRKITDKTLIIVRNNCVGLATISYLTGGTVTVATNTSALIYSDGTNLQKLLIGT